MSLRLGINTCFAVKRWPRSDEWAAVVSQELGLGLVQHSLDLVDLSRGEPELHDQADLVRRACRQTGIELHSTFTGLVAYSSSLLLHPDPGERRRALVWYERAIGFSAHAGARATGGHLGSLSIADSRDEARRELLWAELRSSLEHLGAVAREVGLRSLLVENMACAREPSLMAQMGELLSDGDGEHVPVELCLDVGHQCVPGSSGEDRDPYAWLRRLGARSGVVHLQQSDAAADHHWPFTARYNAAGRIEAQKVLDALATAGVRNAGGEARVDGADGDGADGGASGPALIIEVIPSFEADDRQVLAELLETVCYWQAALGGAC